MINFSSIFPLQDSHIHVTIKRSFTHIFRGLLIEGNIYMVKNFFVQKNKERRCIVAANKLMITFFANILIKPVTNNAPDILRYKFELFPFKKLE